MRKNVSLRSLIGAALFAVFLAGCPMPIETPLLQKVKELVAPVPDIAVKQGSTLIPDGTGSYVFMNATEGSYEDVTFTIENSGTGDLHLDSSPIAITGDQASMFTVNMLPASNTITPAQTASFTIRFAPTGGPGTKTATIGIVSDDPDENPYDFAVRGTIGQEIDIKVASTDIPNNGSYDFTSSGPVLLGTPVDVVFTISNPGTADLVLTGTPLVAISGADAEQFSVTSQPVSPVPARGSATITVRYLPASPGVNTASISVPNSDSDENPFVFVITGAGELPRSAVKIAGGNHTVAVKADGTVWAWGHNQYGKLGDGTTTTRSSPVQVKGLGGSGWLTGVAAVAAYENHTVALKTDGTVWAWGYNQYGQLGDGTTTSSPTPVQVKGPSGVGWLSDVAAVAAGVYFTAALKTDGTVWAWGDNQYGQVGDGTTTTPRTTPVQVSGLTRVTMVAAGGYHMVALKVDGTVWAWGYNGDGQLGDGTAGIPRTSPVQVLGPAGIGTLSGVTAVDAGHNHTVALMTGGTVWTWGANNRGQLGVSAVTYSLTPVQVSGGLSGVTAVAAGGSHMMARKTDGTVCAWGYNIYGQLGDGTTTTPRYAPVQVVGPGGVGSLADVTAVDALSDHTVALKTDGTVWTWGSNALNQLGDATTTNRATPVQVSRLAFVATLGSGAAHSLARKIDGTVWAWGFNFNGRLGDGTTTQRTTPVQVTGLTGVGAVGGGGHHSVALKTDGTVVWAWGLNSSGQLGDGTTTQRTTPVQLTGLPGVVSMVAAGGYHTAAVITGGVWTWGYNSSGQLGDGTTTSSSTPVQVKDTPGTGYLTLITTLDAGNQHTVARDSNGAVWAWGYNYYGELGDNTTVNKLRPVQVKDTPGTGTLSDIAAVAAGDNHTVALKTDGTVVWAWGRNEMGQLGDGTTTSPRKTPVQVTGLTGTVSAVAAGQYHTVALKSDGTVWTWGSNTYGQLGDGTTTQRTAPVQVKGQGGIGTLTGVAAVAAGSSYTLAQMTDGTVWAWGANANGQLGNATTTDSSIPVFVLDPLMLW